GGGSGGSGGAGSGGSGGSGAGASSINPAVSLGGSPSLAYTGSNPVVIVVTGMALVAAGWAVRRRLRARVQ
ncbi:MAG TPA: hypothetical protein VKU86_06385, partial [Acidimicrobiales bacterium]|nr:hypothetical protein [Acidimicrobiales bacterium]